MSDITMTHTIANIDVIAEAVKRIKAGKRSYDARVDAEERARRELRNLQQEAHDLTTAMVNGEDTSHLRDLAGIQKAMQRANLMLDRALEKRHDDNDAMEDAFDALVRAMSTAIVPADADESAQEAA